MEGKREKQWSFKDVVVGKTLMVIIATIVATVLINGLVNTLIRIAAEAKGQMSYFTIQAPISVLFVIPAFFVSTAVICLILNVKSVPNEMKLSQKIVADTEKKFKWNLAYSLMVGYVVLCILMVVASKIMNSIIGDFEADNLTLGNIFGTIFGVLLCLIIPFVITALFIKWFNAMMFEKTGTNVGLIQALSNGELNNELPEKLRNAEAINGIITILKRPTATTLSSAIMQYKFICTAKKIAIKSAKVGVVIGIIIAIISFGMMNSLMKEMENNIRGIGMDLARGIDESRAYDAAASAKKKYNNALFQSKVKAEKEAEFRVRRAADQLNYNANTYEAQRRVNLAKQSIWDAQKASQNYYNNKL